MAKILLLLLLTSCGDNETIQTPADLSMPRPNVDMSVVPLTTCDEAFTCMQACSGHYAECSAGCAGDLTASAQAAWDQFTSCIDLHCGAGDAALPICDNWAVMSCIVCGATYCQPEAINCGNH